MGFSKTFEEMFTQLSGPKGDDLFDSNCQYSPYCHVFIMVYPDLLVASKDSVDDGYLVYLGYQTMWYNGEEMESNKCPFDKPLVEKEVRS